MEREKDNNVMDNYNPLPKQEYSEAEMEMIQDIQDEQQEDMQDDNLLLSEEHQAAYTADMSPEERQNAHSFLHKAAFDNQDTVKTTYLSESELGRPLFNIRFLLDMEDISKFYIDPLVKELGLDEATDNKIAIYFLKKTYNVTDSGMSNKGFSMNLNVTRKMDSTRNRIKSNNIENLKGGKKK